MEHGGDADGGAEVLGVGGDGQQGLARRSEQEAIDVRLVVIGDTGDRRRQGEDDMEIGDRQQLGLAGRQPVLGGRPLALGAVAVATRVIGHMDVAAVLAGRDMAAQRRRAAPLDGRHHLELAEAEVAGIGVAPGWPAGPEDVLRPPAFRGARSRRVIRAFFFLPALDGSSDNGLLTAFRVRLSTWL